MDDMARSRANDVPDLAAIVLGRTNTEDDRRAPRRVDAPERVPAWLDHAPARGYDARSVVVLAIVVAALAAVVGWATTIGREDAAPSNVAAERSAAASSDDALGDAVATVAGVGTSDVMAPKAAAVAPGPNLAVGRLAASRSGSGAGLVTVAIRNAGDKPSAATELLVLADGDVMGRDAVPAIAPGASTRVEVPLDWCPAGSVALVAIVDPGVVVREVNEQDNAVSRSADFGC